MRESHFPDQELNTGYSSESTESEPLDHQGTPTRGPFKGEKIHFSGNKASLAFKHHRVKDEPPASLAIKHVSA